MMGQKPSVLIVDDSDEIRRLFRCVLETHGFAIAEAADAQAAFEQLKQDFFNVVLLDIHLPGVSGLEVLKEIKEHDPYIKVVMITGDSGLDKVIEALDHAAFAYVEKPIDIKRLLTTVSRALTQQHEELFLRKPLSTRLRTLA